MSIPLSPSNIVETGFAQEGRFVNTLNQLPYNGYYHKDDKGRYWTGEKHTAISKQLTDLVPQTTEYTLDTLSKQTPNASAFGKRFTQNLNTPAFSFDYIKPT